MSRATATAALTIAFLAVLALANSMGRHGSAGSSAGVLAPLMHEVFVLRQVESVEVKNPAGEVMFTVDQQLSASSATVVDRRGYLLTCFHCVDARDHAGVRLQLNIGSPANGDSWYPVHIVAVDEARDLALIKVDEAPPLRAATIGRASDLRVGDTVYAVGDGMDVGVSAQRGIVSALDVNCRDDDGDGNDHLVQTDAQVNHGDSGGGLFNADGELVAINEAIVCYGGRVNSGIAMAIPISFARDLLRQMPGR